MRLREHQLDAQRVSADAKNRTRPIPSALSSRETFAKGENQKVTSLSESTPGFRCIQQTDADCNQLPHLLAEFYSNRRIGSLLRRFRHTFGQQKFRRCWRSRCAHCFWSRVSAHCLAYNSPCYSALNFYSVGSARIDRANRICGRHVALLDRRPAVDRPTSTERMD